MPRPYLFAVAAMLLVQPARAEAPAAAPVPVACPAAALESQVYALSLGGNRAGFQTKCVMGDGVREYIFAFNDRGRGPAVRARIALGAQGIPVSLAVDGHDYLKSPIAERFSVKDGTASWKNKVEAGERKLDSPAFYLSQSGVPSETAILAQALLKAEGATLPLLPSGEARLTRVEDRTLTVGDQSRRVTLYTITGLGFQPAGTLPFSKEGTLPFSAGLSGKG